MHAKNQIVDPSHWFFGPLNLEIDHLAVLYVLLFVCINMQLTFNNNELLVTA